MHLLCFLVCEQKEFRTSRTIPLLFHYCDSSQYSHPRLHWLVGLELCFHLLFDFGCHCQMVIREPGFDSLNKLLPVDTESVIQLVSYQELIHSFT